MPFSHPGRAKIDYKNPIKAIFKLSDAFNFETLDGQVGKNLIGNHLDFNRKEFDPDAVRKIQVFSVSTFITGFRLFGVNDVVLFESLKNDNHS